MRSLTWKLALAFLVISLLGVALVALFVRQATVREFDRYVLDQAQSDFIAYVTAYYEANGSWAGVTQRLPQRPPDLPPDPLDPARPGPLPPFALVNQAGRVVVPAEPYRRGDLVPRERIEQGIPIEVNGVVVGTVLRRRNPPERDPAEEQYLTRTNQALLVAAVGGTGVALLLGLLLARTLTRPLRELTAATRAVAQGELTQQVPVRSRDELGDLAAAFNQMSADLARANASRRQMTADIAHDLRTPLTVITGYLESLRDGVLEPTPARFDAIYDEARHLQRLVEDLRTLSLADAGELPLNRQSVSPPALLERLATAYRHQARRQNIALDVRAGHDVPEIDVDPERMMQVLGNLLSNALRYTSEGGEITLAAARRGDSVLLSVQDTGVGIPPDELPRVFDRFYRGDAARQPQKGESGLGLAIAKSIVEAHGGTITVESALGQGTTFTIALPA